jgi:hypothetical protein
MSVTILNKIINMKNYIYSTLLLFFIGINAFGQAPSWSVNENNFQYTMSFVAFVNVNGVSLANENDKVAAFVNGECRGVTNLTYVASEDSYYAYLTVFSNENSEIINFKIYDSTNNVETDVVKTKIFEINEHYGNLFQAYSVANPALSNTAEIIYFDFNDVNVNDTTFAGSQITLDVDFGVDIASLNALFDLSAGAKLFIGTINQISGNNNMDFSTPLQVHVLSEDQTVLKPWEITVNKSLGTATYYKKDAVCYIGGVIKVLFTENEVEVLLIKDGATFAAQTINNGEAIFSNLGVGKYQVKVSGNNKEIVINLNNSYEN